MRLRLLLGMQMCRCGKAVHRLCGLQILFVVFLLAARAQFGDNRAFTTILMRTQPAGFLVGARVVGSFFLTETS
jgi:hypothetical protein